ncbi:MULTISPECIES: alpha/beta fold hydrolase [Paraburkholderia]|uniref:alpha/beta fold hydrolase n=1 Tax=Paraburkholderia TaxID=1822464 RepID=UPI000375766F|nr:MULTISPECIES: alpha/beta fold hydrolase [Paraburkholderia]MDH6147513.1 3-oxoadipate enol-lactonase [Paraburkholderia sp. WSM4179]
MSAPVIAPVKLGTLATSWFESGSGTAGAVLMLHSLGLDARAFDPLRDALPSDWRVVSFDQRGHGAAAAESPRSLEQLSDDACAAIEQCGVNGVHLLGHSMGGAVAALAAVRLGGRVASLTLLATPAAGHPVFETRAQAALDDGMAAAIDATLERWFGAPCMSFASPGSHAIAYARAALSAMNPASFAAAWRALARFEGYPPLAKRLPRTQLIAGAKDLSTPAVAMRSIVEAIIAGGATDTPVFHQIEDAGHMLPLTHPSIVAAALLSHWRAAASRP